ncbi:hypothetical protein F5Y10DRAFT_255870 [Nemania abortiva]|nr:hypothetical protein F5Y10DRAFT_255870 [Nemania abortiva]
MCTRPRKQDIAPRGGLLPAAKIIKSQDYYIPDPSTNNSSGECQGNRDEDNQSPPNTPKRAHIAPPKLPLGLQPSDFHDQHVSTDEEERKQGKQVEIEQDRQEWSIEDDHVLIEVILAKLELSESDWAECARSLGRDQDYVKRRWNSLMDNHAIGLKSSKTRRGKEPDSRQL